MTKLRTLATFTAGLLFAACAKDDPQRELERLVDGYVSTMCSAMVTCSCTPAAAEADCEAAHRTMIEYTLAEETLRYPARAPVPAAIDACLRDLREAVQGCPGPTHDGAGVMGMTVAKAGFSFLVPSCSEQLIFVGTLASGAYCSSPRECAPDLGCDEVARTCAPRAALDESCATIGCAEGLYCSSSLECATPPAAAAACPDGTCAPGSTCVDVDGLMTCVAPHAEDASCTDGAGCVAGTYCDFSDTGLCVAPRADGADCTYDHQCEHLWCSSGTCADPGFCAISSRR